MKAACTACRLSLLFRPRASRAIRISPAGGRLEAGRTGRGHSIVGREASMIGYQATARNRLAAATNEQIHRGSPLRETTAKTWEDFTQLISEFEGSSAFHTPFLFRGQSDASWLLRPKIARIIGDKTSETVATRIEKQALRKFQREARLSDKQGHFPTDDLDVIGWWSVMQHFGDPTRLLDWSRSVAVAAYFAVCDGWNCDGADLGSARCPLP